MSEKPIFVALLDDEFPPKKEFVDNNIFNSAISADNLYELAISENWGALRHLQQLIKDIVCSDPAIDGKVILCGYKNPELFIQDLESGLVPGIVIYDWEYEMPGTKPQKCFFENF